MDGNPAYTVHATAHDFRAAINLNFGLFARYDKKKSSNTHRTAHPQFSMCCSRQYVRYHT